MIVLEKVKTLRMHQSPGVPLMAKPELFGTRQIAVEEIFKEEWAELKAKSEARARSDKIDQLVNMIRDRIKLVHEGWKEMAWRPSLEKTLEFEVRSIWHIFYNAARFANGRHRDRLVVELLLVRGMGDISCFVLAKEGRAQERAPIQIRSQGALWSSLPLIVEDFTQLWVKDCAAMSRSQRRNLTSFLATLGGVGADDRLCGIGIIVLREAFETSREIGSSEDDSEDHEDTDRKMDSLHVLHLYDCARHWLQKAGDRFERLADIQYAEFPSEVGQLGELAKEAGIPDNGGFSVERLRFWNQRLMALQEVDALEPFEGDEDNPSPQSRWPDV